MPRNLTFIGCGEMPAFVPHRQEHSNICKGSMGSAILHGLLAPSTTQECPFDSFTAVVRSTSSVKKLETDFAAHDSVTIKQGGIVEAARDADVILLATKPYSLREVLGAPGMADAVRGKLVISVLAGISRSKILDTIYGEDSVKAGERVPCYVVQATLNLAARVQQCTTVLDAAALDLPEEHSQITKWVFTQIGEVRYLPAQFMPVAAVLAAIPAIASLAVDGILDGAVASGLKRSEAREIVALNLMGLAKLLMAGDTPDAIRERTSSPRGITIQALLELERGGARSTFADAFLKASQHAEGMASIQD